MPDTAFSCGRCGDDSEPAMCQDRHSFDDHGICCVGRCGVCQADMTDDYQGETA